MSTPRPPFRRAPSPLEMAEIVCDRLRSVPWPLSVWLCLSRNMDDSIITHRSESAEEARYRAQKKTIEVGTYRAGISATRVRDDIIAAYGEAN